MELHLNGVSGLTGQPLVDPAKVARIADRLRGKADGPAAPSGMLGWLRGLLRLWQSPHWGLPMGVDALDPAQAGWAVVYHESEPAAVREALAPLVEHRRRMFGDGKVKVLEIETGEDWRSWLARHGAEPGSVVPHRVPYYVLLAGDPQRIPFDFQNLLAVEYAVGRVAFDTAEEYRRYAESIVEYETSTSVPNQREAVFFATRHDPPTRISADRLVSPLAEGLPGDDPESPQPAVAARCGFSSRTLFAKDATEANLAAVLSPPEGSPPPALLFTASHGVGFPCGHPDQRAKQGALLCQPTSSRDLPLFSGGDLPNTARVHGLICFCFACFGAGTPERDEFFYEPGSPPPALAEAPFVARLPQRLLGHRQGGALAVIGHVERAWGYSIDGASGQPQLLPFENTLGGILQGWPVGHAVRDFRQRFAMLSAALADTLNRLSFGAKVRDDDLATLWTERNDARNYAVLGDPAARLRVDVLRSRQT